MLPRVIPQDLIWGVYTQWWQYALQKKFKKYFSQKVDTSPYLRSLLRWLFVTISKWQFLSYTGSIHLSKSQVTEILLYYSEDPTQLHITVQTVMSEPGPQKVRFSLLRHTPPSKLGSRVFLESELGDCSISLCTSTASVSILSHLTGNIKRESACYGKI